MLSLSISAIAINSWLQPSWENHKYFCQCAALPFAKWCSVRGSIKSPNHNILPGSFQEALGLHYGFCLVSSKHNISIFPADYYLLTWFSGWHNKRYSLQNVLLWKKAETNGSVVYLAVQTILCLNQEKTSLHTKQGEHKLHTKQLHTNSCGEEAATETQKRIYCNINSLRILCACLPQLWLKSRMWSWQKLFVSWSLI